MHLCDIQNISCAYTGCAASVLVKARTVSSLFDIKSGIKGGHDAPLDPLDIPHLKNARTRLGDAQVIIIDEVSMIGSKLLGDIHSRLCQIAVSPELHNKEFGGKGIILVGDFFQIRPVGDTALYRSVMDKMVYKTSGSMSLTPRDPISIGIKLFLQFDLSQLVTQVRAATDLQHADHLRIMRSPVLGQQAIPETMIEQLLRSQLSSKDTSEDELLPFSQISNAWALAPVLVSTNEERENVIELLGQRVSKLLGVPLVKWRIPLRTSWYNTTELESIYESTPGAWGYFVQGALAFVTENQNPLKGVANGTMGEMHSLVIAAKQSDYWKSRISAALPGDIVDMGHDVPTFVNLRLHLSKERVASWGKNDTLVKNEIVVPIGMTKFEKTYIRIQGGIGRYHQSRIVPLRQTHAYEPGFSLTFHKVQGKTLERVVLELSERPFTPGIDFNSLLVALSRVSSLCNLRIVGLNDKSALDYLRSLRPAQELMFWIAGFENGCGKWSISGSLTAVEHAIDGGHFTEATKACNKLKCPELCRRLQESKKTAASHACPKTTTKRSKAPVTNTALAVTDIAPLASNSVAVNHTSTAAIRLKTTASRSNCHVTAVALPAISNALTHLFVLTASVRHTTISALNVAAQKKNKSLHFFTNIFCPDSFRSTVLDFVSLQGNTWLTGEIINDFLFSEILFPRLTLQDEHGERAICCRPDVIVFDSYFFRCLNRNGYTIDANVTHMITHLESRGRSAFVPNTEAVIPVHINGNHWILAVADYTVRILYLLDPKQLPREKHPYVSKLLTKFFSSLDLHGTNTPWTIQTVVTNLPKQTDDTSCGIFISFYALYWINYRKFPTTRDFVQDQVPNMRLFMASRLSSVAHGDLRILLENNKLQPDMSDLPISLRNMFLNIPLRNLHIWNEKPADPNQIVPTSPNLSVRHRPDASPGAITDSPEAKSAKIQLMIASPG